MSQQHQHQANMIVAFVIDTSESMAAKTSGGRSLLDHAKDIVGQMTVKSRQTPSHHVLIRNCLLLTTEDWPGNVKTSWADWGDKPEKRMARFQEQLKKLKPSGQNPAGPAVGKAFHMLGQHRLRYGVDTWGKGRSPWCTEPGAVILISDGKHATAGVSNSGVPIGIDMDALTEGARGAVGAELCGKPFRWDQRLFSLILGGRAEGGRGEGGGGLVGGGGGIGYALSATETVLKSTCEETGGCLKTWDGEEEDTIKRKTLAYHVNVLMLCVQKKGPVVMFRSEASLHGGAGDGDDFDDDFDGFNALPLQDLPKPPAARAGLVVRGGTGVWPIPEPFWVDRNLDVLPPRPEAQPELVFRKPEPGSTDAASSAEILEQLGVTVDHYELEWCGTGARLEVPRAMSWQLFVKESGQATGNNKPFGYLRSSQAKGRTVMVVLPYNYDDLIPLLQLRASTVQATKSTAPPGSGSPWARDFSAYLKGVPSYYLPALERVLQPFGVQSLITAEGLPGGGGGLHRKIVEKLNSLKELAGRQMERADRIERAGRAQDPEQRQQQQESSQSAAGGGGSSSASKNTYANAFQVPVGELLSQWEGMRAQLFGTGGATVSGLFNGGPGPPRRPRPPSANTHHRGSPETVGGVERSALQSNRRGLGRKGGGDGSDRGAKGKGEWGARAVLRSPVLGCVAESLAPARSTHEMSNFMPRMQREGSDD